MARNKHNSNLIAFPALPQTAVDAAGKHVPTQSLQTLPFWNGLKKTEQETVRAETQQTLAAFLMEASSRLRIGQHLLAIQTALLPYNGAWGQYLSALRKFNPNLNERKAYRYITGYKNAESRLPGDILAVAMVRGMDILGYTEDKPLGRYTEAVQALPPPANPDAAMAEQYLDRLDDTRRELGRTASPATTGTVYDVLKADPNLLRERGFRTVRNDAKKLPPDQQRAFVESIFGMVLTALNMPAMTVRPQPVPEAFARGRGRAAGTTTAAQSAA